MLFSCNKYLPHFLQKTIVSVVLALFSCSSSYAQDDLLKKDTFNIHLNPLLRSSFKKPVKANPTLNERLKQTNNQLMSWQTHALTAEQIEERDRKENEFIESFRSFNAFTTYTFRSFTNYVADDIITSWIKNKNKKPLASLPKF